MGDLVVLYEPTVSAVVEASKVGGRNAIYAHLHDESVKTVGKSVDRVVLVVEHVNSLAKNAMALLGEKARLVVARKRWYADYVYKHLLEPRMKDELTKSTLDEYSVVLRAEYKTLEMCRKALSTITPRKIGDFTFATVPRLPTGDIAVLYYEMYRAPVLVASMRDTGIAWSALTDKDTMTELAKRFSRVGYVDSKPNGILSGFIITYPESPKAYLEVIEEVLQNVTAKPPESIKPSKTVEAVKTVTSLYDYLKFKSRCLAWSSNKTIIGGETYVVVYCGRNTPHYVSTVGDTTCTVMFYLPPPDRLAIVTHFKPEEVRTNRFEAKISPVTATPDAKYISIVPKNVVRELRSMLKKYGKAVMSIA